MPSSVLLCARCRGAVLLPAPCAARGAADQRGRASSCSRPGSTRPARRRTCCSSASTPWPRGAPAGSSHRRGRHGDRAVHRRHRRHPGREQRGRGLQLRRRTQLRISSARRCATGACTASSSSSVARDLEQDREEDAKRAVADERLRIAQELHDVVAHSMGVIAVQAGVGAHVIDTDPDEAKQSLEAISHDEPIDARGDPSHARGAARRRRRPSYAPAPGLADLDRLVARRRRCRASRSTCRPTVHAPSSHPASTSPRTASCRRR